MVAAAGSSLLLAGAVCSELMVAAVGSSLLLAGAVCSVLMVAAVGSSLLLAGAVCAVCAVLMVACGRATRHAVFFHGPRRDSASVIVCFDLLAYLLAANSVVLSDIILRRLFKATLCLTIQFSPRASCLVTEFHDRVSYTSCPFPLP